MKRRALAFLLAGTVVATGLTALPQSGGRGSASAENVTGQMVVDKAMHYLHDKYALTGSTPKTGFSCIGFVYYVFQSLGIDMPGNLPEAIATYPRVSEANLLPGDIVFFKNTWWKGVSHVAIYIGNGRVIHAENFHRGVNISSIRNDPVEGSYWQHHYLVAERVLTGEASPPNPTKHQIKRWVTVSSASLNLRTGPSLGAGIVTVLANGTEMGVLGRSGDWLNVLLNGTTEGWVYRFGVVASKTTHVDKPSPAQAVTGRAGVVAVEGLHVHTQPVVSATIIRTLHAGQRLRVIKHGSGWDKVRVGGVTGWSVSWGVKMRMKRRPAGHQRRTAPETTAQSYQVVPGVRIHAHPSLTAAVVAYTVPGMTVQVLGRRGAFVQVQTSGNATGWMVASFVTGLGQSASPAPARHRQRRGRPGVLTVTAHFRTGPSLSATIIRWQPAGTHLRVLKTIPDWDYVRLHTGERGWIWGTFIRS